MSGKFCYFLPDCVAVDGQLKSTSNTIQNVKVAAETCSVGKHLSGSIHLKLFCCWSLHLSVKAAMPVQVCPLPPPPHYLSAF